MELGRKGSFQAVKLQRPARTTVCSRSTKDMTAMCVSTIVCSFMYSSCDTKSVDPTQE